MTAYVIYLDQIPKLLAAWSKEMEVLVPVEQPEGVHDFEPWSEGTEIAWDYDLAYNTLKRYFLPPKEPLIRYDVESTTAEPIFDSPTRLLFGVHPYDIRAINQLDQLMEQGAPDYNYTHRRENITVFALEPARIAPTSFWASMGADRVDHGFDLYWTKISPAAFFVEVGSSKGEAMLKAAGPIEEATLTEREAARRERSRIRAESRLRGLKFPYEDTPALLARNWDSKVWQHRSRNCLSCGSCILVCPTCYCFDVREELDIDLKKGTRYREWDGCMLPSFTLVAGDHNFRAHRMERYRHRYYRKGKYIHDKIAELGCVGCGRCVAACTAKIANPMAVFNELWEAEQG